MIDHLEGLGYIKHQVVDVDWGPGEEEHQADQDQHQVGFLSPCQFPVVCVDATDGYVGTEGTAHPGVDDPHHRAGDQVLEGEADEGVGQVENLA